MKKLTHRVVVIAVILGSLMLAEGCRLQQGQNAANQFYEQGLAALDENKTNEAIAFFRKAVEEDPSHTKARCRLAKLYLDTNRKGMAEREFRAALERDPGLITEAKLPLVRLLYQRRAYEQAIPYLRDLAAGQIKDPSVSLMLGNALLKTGHVEEGREIVEKTAEEYPDDRSVKLALAFFYENAGMVSAAEKVLQEMRDKLPDSSEPYVALIDFYLREGLEDRAQETAASALARDLAPKEMYHRLFLLENRHRRHDAALTYLESAVKADPGDPEMWMLLGDYRFFLKRYAKARETYQHIVATWPDLGPAQARIAEAYIAEGRFEEALRHTEGMLAREPENKRARLLRALLYIREGDTEKARAEIQRARKIDPNSAEGHFLYGLSLLRDHDYAGAFPELLQAVRRDTNSIRARLGLAYAYFQMGRFLLAVDELDKILAVQPDHPQARVIRAVALIRLKDYERAASDYRYLMARGLTTPEMRLHLVEIYIVQGKLDDALNIVREVLRRDPGFSKALEATARIYLAKGDHRKAVEICDRYLKDRPADLEIGSLKAQILIAQEEYGMAEGLLRLLIAKHPKAVSPVRLMAIALKKQRNYKQATIYYQKALNMAPRVIQTHMELAEIYRHMGQFDKAAEAYEAVLRIDRFYGPAANNLAYLYAERNERLDEALLLSLKAFESMPQSAAVRDTLGWTYLKKGSPLLARMHLSETVRRSPGTPLFRYHLGVALHESNDLAGAEKALSEAIQLGLGGKELAEARNLLEKMKRKGVSS